MKKLLLILAGTAVLTGGAISTQARDRDHDGREDSIENRQQHLENLREKRRASRRVYVVERGRPVERDVFVDEGGRYYSESRGRRVYVTHYFNSYPDRYFDHRGHRRVGIALRFD